MSSLKPLLDYLDKENVNTDELRNERKQKWERMFAKYTSSTDDNSITLQEFEQLYPDISRVEIENPHTEVFRKYMRQHSCIIDQLSTLSDEENLDQSEYEFLEEYEDDFGDLVAHSFDKSENKENIETSNNDSSSLLEDSDHLYSIVKERNNASMIQIPTPLCNVSPVTLRGEKGSVKKFRLFHNHTRSTLDSPTAVLSGLNSTSKSDLLSQSLTEEKLNNRKGSCIGQGIVQNFNIGDSTTKTRVAANIEDSTAKTRGAADIENSTGKIRGAADIDVISRKPEDGSVGEEKLKCTRVKHVEYSPDQLLDKMMSLQLKGNSRLDVAISPHSTPISSSTPVKKSALKIGPTEVETSKYCENSEEDFSSEYESNVSDESLVSGYVSSLSPTSHYTRIGK